MTRVSESTNPVRLVVILAGCLGLLAMFTVAFVDGPDPSHAFRNLISVHDSLIPAHTSASPGPGDRPRLEGSLSIGGDDLPFQTWMFRWRGRWASVHRVSRTLTLPPQARIIERAHPERATFDVGDLALLVWDDGNETWVIAGSDAAPSLLALSQLVLTEGIDALSRSTDSRSGPSPAAGPTVEPAPPSAPAPQ
ncbi:MAG: hypothetical protein KDA24_26340 [Deltaproteobacteria bacterium]|nr:hypothetical protein [Deltaproteobacteria bacterium]